MKDTGSAAGSSLETRLAELLREALGDPGRRAHALRTFQDTGADTPTSAEAGRERLWEIFSDLAIDLEFYEPDPGYRAASRSYYGDDRLEELLHDALREIDRLEEAPDAS